MIVASKKPHRQHPAYIQILFRRPICPDCGDTMRVVSSPKRGPKRYFKCGKCGHTDGLAKDKPTELER